MYTHCKNYNDEIRKYYHKSLRTVNLAKYVL